ncbi:hypothetical protein [Streptomyces sp. NPDC001381]|uniref:hypothetical protein n=1 Tax=Streptomyces sp. NPDC001381 TaxID=3364567 RepID=UPI00367BBF78
MSGLYDHALRLLRESPDGLPPRRGFPLPCPPETPDTAPALSHEAMRAAVRQALDPLPEDSGTVHRRLDSLGVRRRHQRTVRAVVAGLALSGPQRDRGRSLARELVRTGTTAAAVTAGLALLARLGEPEDVPCLIALGQFRDLCGAAVEALDAVDRRRTVLAELDVLPTDARLLGASTARRIAEAVLLPDLLDRHPSHTGLLALAGRLLARMAGGRDDSTELPLYRDALRLYETVVRRARLLPPTVGHHATLLSLALDLSSGPGVLLDWPPGRRSALLGTLGRLLAEPRWAVSADDVDSDEPERRLRARWIRHTRRRPFALPAAPGRLRVEVVVGDPVDREPVETRILLDGRPLVPAVFPLGPAHSPELLLEEGQLRAGPQAREVQLAEASCTEGCCGALHVTIRRDGDEVVWEKWRRPPLPGLGRSTPVLPPVRFDAAAYDAEIARAEADLAWSWPARTLARLIRKGLVERPELLSRWDMERGWISTGSADPDHAEVHLWYRPGLGAGTPDGDPLVFRWTVPDDGTPPGIQAAAALRRLSEENPAGYARVIAGSRGRAEELGFPWPYDH